jgi:hypothetical protein
MELGQGQFARAIEQRLMKLSTGKGTSPGQFAAVSHALAGALFSSLGWWIDRGMPLSAAEMDHSFHRLVWSGVNASVQEPVVKPARSAGH